MLKFKLLLNLISKHTKTTIISLVVLVAGFFIVRTFLDLRSEVQAAHRREHNLKSDKLELAKNDSTNTIIIAEIKDSLEGVSLAYQKLQIKYKQLYLSGEATQTEVGNKRDSVAFKEETECAKVSGFTKTNPPEYGLDILLKPFSLEIEITDFDKDIYSIVKPSIPCIQIDTVNFKVAPDLKGVYKDGFDTGEFILGGVLVGCGVLLYYFFR